MLTLRLGQKCSALSRCYVPESLWNNGFRDTLASEVSKIQSGPATDFKPFMGPVIAQHSFNKITGIITKAKEAGGEVIAGGKCE